MILFFLKLFLIRKDLCKIGDEICVYYAPDSISFMTLYEIYPDIIFNFAKDFYEVQVTFLIVLTLLDEQYRFFGTGTRKNANK